MEEMYSLETEFKPKTIYSYEDNLILTEANNMYVYNITSGLKLIEYTLSVDVWDTDISSVYMTYD